LSSFTTDFPGAHASLDCATGGDTLCGRLRSARGYRAVVDGKIGLARRIWR
jgi:hypothetical protein